MGINHHLHLLQKRALRIVRNTDMQNTDIQNTDIQNTDIPLYNRKIYLYNKYKEHCPYLIALYTTLIKDVSYVLQYIPGILSY